MLILIHKYCSDSKKKFFWDSALVNFHKIIQWFIMALTWWSSYFVLQFFKFVAFVCRKPGGSYSLWLEPGWSSGRKEEREKKGKQEGRSRWLTLTAPAMTDTGANGKEEIAVFCLIILIGLLVFHQWLNNKLLVFHWWLNNKLYLTFWGKQVWT